MFPLETLIGSHGGKGAQFGDAPRGDGKFSRLYSQSDHNALHRRLTQLPEREMLLSLLTKEPNSFIGRLMKE